MRFERASFGYVVALEPGEELIRSLIRFARREEVEAGALTGLGAVRGVELGFYDLARQAYERRRLDEELEACALVGNLALVDGEPFPHVHGVFGRRDCTVVGGHVFEAVCSVTLELAVQTSAPAWVRGPVAHCNLMLLALEGRP